MAACNLEDVDLTRRLARSARIRIFPLHFLAAGVAELADALDSKSSDRKIVWVRAPPPASPLKHCCTFAEYLSHFAERSN